MIIVIEGVLIAVLIAIGYVASCFYLSNIKWKSADFKVCSLNKERIVYLVITVIVGIYLMYILHFFKETDIASQITTICLIYTLLPAAAVDFKVKKIPNQFLIVSLLVRVMLYALEFMQDIPSAVFALKEDILGATIMGSFFLLISLIFKNGIGMGDVKLFALMGLYQGLAEVINSIFFSLIASFFVAVTLLATKKRRRSDTIPFGPCILLGVLMALRLTSV